MRTNTLLDSLQGNLINRATRQGDTPRMSPSGLLLLLCLSLATSANSWHQATTQAELLQQQGRLTEAETLLRQTLTAPGELPPNAVAFIYNNLGSLYQDQRRFEEANRHYRLSIDFWERAGAKHRLALAKTLNNQASLYWDHQRVAEAERLLIRSSTIQLEILGPTNPSAAELYYNLGAMHWNRGNAAKAEPAYRRFLDIPHQEPLKMAIASIHLALIYRKTNRLSDSSRLLNRARDLWESGRHPLEPYPQLLLDLAVGFLSANRLPEAAAVAREFRYGLKNGRTAKAMWVHASILRRTNRKSEAKALEAQAQEIEANDLQSRLDKQTIDLSALR